MGVVSKFAETLSEISKFQCYSCRKCLFGETTFDFIWYSKAYVSTCRYDEKGVIHDRNIYFITPRHLKNGWRIFKGIFRILPNVYDEAFYE